jgi:hypothetical protein
MALIVVAALSLGVYAVRSVLGGGCNDDYCPSSLRVEAPQGFEFVSRIYEYQREPQPIPAGSDVGIEVALSDKTTDGRNLAFYQLNQEVGAWQPLGPASLNQDGDGVTGRLPSTPPVLAVMRRFSAAGHVIAFLDAGDRLHPDAGSLATIVATRDLRPAADGAVEGELSQVAPQEGLTHYPVISASTTNTGTLVNLDTILNDSGKRSRHVQQIVAFVEQTDVAGIAVSYRDLRADQRISFALFVQELADALHARGKTLLVDLPAPVRSVSGVDEGAYDWPAIGIAADIVTLAPIRDQSTYRQDLPIVLEYLRNRIDINRLVMTVTPYAAEKSQDGVRPLRLTEAMGIATKLNVAAGDLATNENVDIVGFNIDKSEGLSGLLWDPNTATVAFTYKFDGGRTVWIENFFSVGFKLEFIPTYGLGGVAIEDASDDQFLGNIWSALVPYLQTGQPVLMQPNPADLDPRWTASGGTLDGGQSGIVRWTAPAQAGSYTVNLVLSEGTFLFDSEIKLNVKDREDAANSSNGG